MEIKVEDLESSGFFLKDKFHYKDLSAFVQQYLSKTNAATITFLLFNVVFILGVAGQVVFVAVTHAHGLTAALYFLAGIVLTIFIIPVHEAIHAVAYKRYGAPSISFEISLKKLVVLTVADRFVANKHEFIRILLAPFMILTLLLIVLYFISGMYFKCTVMTSIMTHSFLCAGDFGLTSYFLSHKDDTIVTYDDKLEKTSYFFRKANIV